MRFGPVALGAAEGAVLAHSTQVQGQRLRKGRVLGPADIAALRAEGVTEIIVAQLEPGDLSEDDAAAQAARALAPDPAQAGLSMAAPFTGRVNLHAMAAGVLRVDAAAIARFNAVDEAVTLATLPDFARVAARDMVATVKILPFAVPAARVAAACAALASGPGLKPAQEEAAHRKAPAPALAVHPFRALRPALIATRIPGMKESVVAKGLAAVQSRLAGLGLAPAVETVVPHATAAVTDALLSATQNGAELALILGGSATQDRDDVGPAALRLAGGRLARFGMPVDPGNLLFLGDLPGCAVVGLPGCVRSPALNGADWVLERILAGLEVGGGDIAAMGVGGLLKEIPTRPQPRAAAVRSQDRPDTTPTDPAAKAARGGPAVAALILAAGAARRMRGRDKLLEDVEGQPLLRRVATACLGSSARQVQVVVPDGAAALRDALAGLDLRIVENPQAAEGMGASIRAGMRQLGPGIDAVVLVLADMPELNSPDLDRLIAAFDPEAGHEICRAVTASGKPGHPVLFGRRFFESLAQLEGDAGARALLRSASEFVTDVPTAGEAAVTDLDDPEAWAAWRAGRAALSEPM
ncbi:MAG: molybdopterin-binding/glycosyltransferase family 2 protein [Pseudomonadota bacterium]